MSILIDEVHVISHVRNGKNGLPIYVCEHTRRWPNR
jgi:hypothetical protein